MPTDGQAIQASSRHTALVPLASEARRAIVTIRAWIAVPSARPAGAGRVVAHLARRAVVQAAAPRRGRARIAPPVVDAARRALALVVARTLAAVDAQRATRADLRSVAAAKRPAVQLDDTPQTRGARPRATALRFTHARRADVVATEAAALGVTITARAIDLEGRADVVLAAAVEALRVIVTWLAEAHRLDAAIAHALQARPARRVTAAAGAWIVDLAPGATSTIAADEAWGAGPFTLTAANAIGQLALGPLRQADVGAGQP